MFFKKLKILFFIKFLIVASFLACYYNYPFWNYFKTDNFEVLQSYQAQNIKGFRGKQILIHKDFKTYLDRLDVLARFYQVHLIINQSYRFKNESLKGAIVKSSKNSNHKAGFAIDFNIKSDGVKYYSQDLKIDNLKQLPIEVQNFINQVRKDKDLRWGGDFKNEDPIHIDFPLNLKNKRKWEICSQKCYTDFSKRIPIWKIWL